MKRTASFAIAAGLLLIVSLINRKLERKGDKVIRYRSYANFIKEKLSDYKEIDSNTFYNAFKKN